MSDHRSDSDRPSITPGPAPAGAEASLEDAIAALVRTHGATPPYDSVDWNALALRVVDNAQGELKRRQHVAPGRLRDRMARRQRDNTLHLFHDGEVDRLAAAPGTRRIGRHWFEVTAGWVRPTMIAAALVTAVAATLTMTMPSTPSGNGLGDSSAALVSASTASSYAADDREAGDSAMEAAVVGRGTDQQVDLQFGPRTRDALFTAVVEER